MPKDVLGHGSNPRSWGLASHQAGIASTIPALVGYHGTTHQFEGPPGIPTAEDFMLDRMLGPHFAADREVSLSFITERVNGRDVGPKPGGRMLTVELPSEDKFLEARQERYNEPHPGEPAWRGMESDQRAIERMVAEEGYRQDPEMLARYLNQARAIPPDEAAALARDLAAGKTVHLKTEGRDYTLASFTKDFGGRPYNAPDRQRMVGLARKAWQAKGYRGIKYTDTSPMEMARAKNPQAYILFDPKDAKVKANA